MEMAVAKQTKSPEKVESDLLDFDKMHQTARKAVTKTASKEESLSQEEIESIPEYINDISKYIKSYARQGKFTFKYDCTNLSKLCFAELANQFKQKNPRFFVLTDFGTRILTVDWSGKNEV